MAPSKTKRGSRRRPRVFVVIAVAAAAAAIFVGAFFFALTRPAQIGANSHLVHFDKPVRLSTELQSLQKSGDLRSAWAAGILSRFVRPKRTIAVGTYQVGPGMSAAQILASLSHPIRRMVRIPDTNWSMRTGRLLELKGVCTAQDYMACVRDPKSFSSLLSIPVPEKSLEGMLYPDTYDLPPMSGARKTVTMQLRAFEDKVVQKYPEVTDWHRVLTIASLIQLEADTDRSRYLISSVIHNRIKKNMPLQIDASLLYAIDKWRRLTNRDYRTIPGPFNLYRHKGLPPGPICSPTVKSIDAALHPAQTDYLFYVSLPDGRTLYSSTYKQHLANTAIEHAQLKARDAVQVTNQ